MTHLTYNNTIITPHRGGIPKRQLGRALGYAGDGRSIYRALPEDDACRALIGSQLDAFRASLDFSPGWWDSPSTSPLDALLGTPRITLIEAKDLPALLAGLGRSRAVCAAFLEWLREVSLLTDTLPAVVETVAEEAPFDLGELIDFEGWGVQVLTYQGRQAVLASELGAALGYAPRVLVKTLGQDDEFEAGKHHEAVAGEELDALRAVLNKVGTSEVSGLFAIPATAPSATLLYPEGIHLLLIKTQKPRGRELRRALAEVLEELRVEGSYTLPSATPSSTTLAPIPDDPLLAQLEVMRVQRLQVLELERRQSELAARVERIEAREQATAQALTQIHDLPPLTLVPSKSTRAALEQLMRSAGVAAGGGEAFAQCWRKLYEEFYARFRVNLRSRAEKRRMKKIEVAEADGFLDQLYSLACEMFRASALEVA